MVDRESELAGDAWYEWRRSPDPRVPRSVRSCLRLCQRFVLWPPHQTRWCRGHSRSKDRSPSYRKGLKVFDGARLPTDKRLERPQINPDEQSSIPGINNVILRSFHIVDGRRTDSL
jgi:hypothetical protein